MNTKKKQKMPKWFDGTVYSEGDEVRNPFSGETYTLNAKELSIYDFIMGCNQMWGMGLKPTKQTVNQFDLALTWFKVNNPEAYMALLD
tara:strand:- start:59 stop:322 length:264 start_codon:yes stop_codon:yes gene_type:complete